MGVEDAVLGVDGDELDALRNIKKARRRKSRLLSGLFMPTNKRASVRKTPFIFHS